MDDMNDFEKELEQFLDFDSPKVGDIKTGTIISISQQGAIVALENLKRDGIVQHSDLAKLEDEERESLKVNDEVTVKVVSTADPNSLIVSIFQARMLKDWDEVEALKESGELVEVEINGYNKGGLTAPYGRLRGFIPLSQISGLSRGLDDRERQRRMAKMRGETAMVKVIEVDRQKRRLVFSERAGRDEWRAEKRSGFIADLKPGDRLTGKVRSIRDFGVFVDLGPTDGLIHVSELAWYRVNHPSEVVSQGEEIEVEVIKVDPEKEKVSLTRKTIVTNPWNVIHDKYGEGQLVEGNIMRLTDYGAFVELEPGVEGLLHITQLSRTPVNNVDEIVQQGEKHLLRVLSIDNERQRIRLSLKAVSASEQIEWMTRQMDEQEEQSIAAEELSSEETSEEVSVDASADASATEETVVEETVETTTPDVSTEEATSVEESVAVVGEAVDESNAEAVEAGIEADAKSTEEAGKVEVEAKATEEATKVEAEAKATEEAAKAEAEAKATEEAAKAEAEAKAAEEATKAEAEAKVAKEAAEAKAAKEAAKAETEAKTAKKAAKVEAKSAQASEEAVSEEMIISEVIDADVIEEQTTATTIVESSGSGDMIEAEVIVEVTDE